MLAAATKPEAVGEIFNIGNATENTMAEVVGMVLDAAGSDLEPVAVDTGEKYGAVYEDIGRRVPAVEKAARLLRLAGGDDVPRRASPRRSPGRGRRPGILRSSPDAALTAAGRSTP